VGGKKWKWRKNTSIMFRKHPNPNLNRSFFPRFDNFSVIRHVSISIGQSLRQAALSLTASDSQKDPIVYHRASDSYIL
jgi:hypothetical protein